MNINMYDVCGFNWLRYAYLLQRLHLLNTQYIEWHRNDYRGSDCGNREKIDKTVVTGIRDNAAEGRTGYAIIAVSVLLHAWCRVGLIRVAGRTPNTVKCWCCGQPAICTWTEVVSNDSDNDNDIFAAPNK